MTNLINVRLNTDACLNNVGDTKKAFCGIFYLILLCFFNYEFDQKYLLI